MWRKIIALFRLLNWLSIDVALGAAAGCYVFSRQMNITIQVADLLSLALTVWIIYTLDHLLDSRKIIGTASKAIYRFHQRWKKGLGLLVLTAVVLDIICVFYMDPSRILPGIILAVCAFIYLLANEYLKYFKEIIVAVLYCMGILLPIYATRGWGLLSIHFILLSAQFFMVAWINLVLFSYFEIKYDRQDGQISFATNYGVSRTYRLISVLVLIHFILFFVNLYTAQNRPLSWMFLIMTLILSVELYFEATFREGGLYRVVGDFVFFLPLLILI